MSRSATIVSFDDAKRSSRATGRRERRMRGIPASERPLAFVDPGFDARLSNPSHRSQRLSSPASDDRLPRAKGAPRASSSPAVSSRRRPAPSWYDGPDERAVHAEQMRRAQIREEARDAEETIGEKPSLAQRARKLAAKRKADKVFGSSNGPAVEESASRAAVYKGEMGSVQRRASRMQGEASGDAQDARSRRKRRVGFGPKLRIAAAVMGCLALVCVFLYQPAQQYYSAMRHNAALEAEYAALQERGDALQDSVDALSTEAGMEDLARDQLDWVKSGEISVSVSGVEADAESDSGSIPPNVSAGSVEPPDTWYSGVLDPLFGVE